MENNALITQKKITNVLLGIIAVTLIAIVLIPKDKENNNRFFFDIDPESDEIYILDGQTGTLFITTPELAGGYEDEVWAQLNPTKKGKAIPFKELLIDNARRKLRKEFLKKKKEAEARNSQ